MFKKTSIVIAVSTLISSFAMAENLSNSELLKKLEEQEKQLMELKAQVDATAAAVDEQASSSSFANTTIGGYGELHYNNFDTKESIDFHRFVLFIGHSYSDKLRFFSELELEHSLAGDGKPGEVELEQAYIEYDLSSTTTLKGGLFLVPVGIINETHEPNTFYGVERNPIEKNIIPATWWEAGVASTFRVGEGIQFDFAAHSGLDVDENSFNIRSGRQKVAKANADSMAYTSRVRWTGVPGLEVAASVQIQDDITQGRADAEAKLYELHTAYQSGAFSFRALYAMWDIDSGAADALNKDRQDGCYLETSYKLSDELGVFARANMWSTSTTEDGCTLDYSDKNQYRQSNVGFNYWLDENVALKIDVENRLGAHQGSGYNVGIGYQF